VTDAPDDRPPTPQPAADPASVELAVLAAEAIDDKKGIDIAGIDVAELLQITEVFVIATGTSRRQVQTLAEAVRERLRDDAELRPLRSEGEEEGEWVLLDFGSVVVHLFQPDQRAFYDLERLWADAPRVPLGVA
jgi:ribosome-associated protein